MQPLVKKIAIYPGTFDPVTFGHLDIIRRAAKIFDAVIVGVAKNETKNPLFSTSERITMLEKAIKDLAADTPIEVHEIDGLLVNFCQGVNCYTVLRGLRAISDFEYEFQMALTNRRLDERLETLFMTPLEEHTFLSSRLVKEIASLQGDVSSFVPEFVKIELKKKLQHAFPNAEV